MLFLIQPPQTTDLPPGGSIGENAVPTSFFCFVFLKIKAKQKQNLQWPYGQAIFLYGTQLRPLGNLKRVL